VAVKDFSRTDRLAAQISRELSEILSVGLSLPEGLFISVTEVKLSKDLRIGKVFYSAFGGDDALEKAELFLRDHYKQIRMELAHRIRIKFIPELVFTYDASIERGQRINELLNRIKQDEQPE
jgi:ribosome-binding factor A